MRSSENTENIFKALVLVRSKIEGLAKTRQSYTNKYVPLDDVVDHLKAILPGHELGYVQLPEGGTAQTIGLSTRIIHSSGEWLEATAEFALTDMKSVNVSQGAGAAISYFRRYALCAAFGIVGDDETDGNGGKSTPGQKKQIDKDKLSTLASIMNKTRKDGTAYFSEERKKHFRELAKANIDQCLKEAEIALEELESVE